MRVWYCVVLSLCLLTCGGCSRTKSTAQLLEDLKGPEERDRLIAVRLLPQRKQDAAQIVPALIEALKDKENDIRLSAAIGLGSFAGQARNAVPALQKVAQEDRDARVRQAAAVALSRVHPSHFPDPAKQPAKKR